MKKKELLFIFLLCYITRLPQLLSPNLMLDGDECVVAEMARHMYEGKGITLYFYGQSYGFSFIEMLFTCLHYLLFGISELSVKLAMLLMWAIGILFFYKTLLLLKLKTSYLPALITLVFICAPSWAVWSMKARGGYLSAFMLCFIITSLLFNDRLTQKKGTWILIGVLLLLLCESHILWLPGLLPLVIYKTHTSGKKINWLILSTGVVISGLLLFLYKRGIPDIWRPQVLDLSPGILHQLTDLPRRLFVQFSGSYYLSWTLPPAAVTAVWAASFTALVFIILITWFVLILRKNRPVYLFLFGISFLGSFSYVFILGDNSARYLLPLTGYFLLLSAVLADGTRFRMGVKSVAAFFILTGIISLYTFKEFRFKAHTTANVRHLIDKLEARNINSVFCCNALLQWQLLFYSDDRINARFSTYGERYPENLRKVNEQYRTHPETTAITGTMDELGPVWKGESNPVDSLFFFIPKPNVFLLSNSGFDFEKPDYSILESLRK